MLYPKISIQKGQLKHPGPYISTSLVGVIGITEVFAIDTDHLILQAINQTRRPGYESLAKSQGV